MAMWFTGG